jgi:hypothetical protein
MVAVAIHGHVPWLGHSWSSGMLERATFDLNPRPWPPARKRTRRSPVTSHDPCLPAGYVHASPPELYLHSPD